MNKLLIVFILLFLSFYSCKKEKDSEKDPCSVLINRIYQFPTIPENDTMSYGEIVEFINLPKDVCGCISTDGLVETCCNYPDIELYLVAGPVGYPSGYELLAQHFRGIGELESRKDEVQSILNKYKSIDTLQIYNWKTFFLELTIGRDSTISHSNKEQRKELVEALMAKYLIKQKLNKFFGVFMTEGTIYAMAHIMYGDNFKPFIDIYEVNDKIQMLIEYGAYYDDEDVINAIVNLANTYLLK